MARKRTRSRTLQDIDYLRARDYEQETEIKQLRHDVAALRGQRGPVKWWKAFLLGVPVLIIMAIALESDITIEDLAITNAGLLIIAAILFGVLGVYLHARDH